MNFTNDFIKRLQDCDRKAFEILFNEFAGIIKAIAFRYLKDMDQAEDILQDTFVAIYQKIHQYSWKGSFEGWIRRITVNNCIRFLNDKKKMMFQDIESQRIPDEEVVEEVNQENAKSLVNNTEFSQEQILNIVSELPDGFRIVFSMYVLEDYKHKEIAELLGISESTSKTQLLRARKLLQRKLYTLAQKNQSAKNNVFFKEVIGKKGSES